MARFEFVAGDTKVVGGRTLTRVRRLNDGELGGYIESPLNLSQDGTCFLHGDSVAYESAQVTENAQVYGAVRGNVFVGGSAVLRGEAFDSARIVGDAHVYGRAYGHASVEEDAHVYGEVSGNVVVKGRAKVYGRVSGQRIIDGDMVVY